MRQERETQISSLRVEIMADGGPDGYLLSSPASNMTFNGEGHPAALFPDVQRTMQAGAFLPLDDYIKESEYLRSEDHFAPVFVPENRRRTGRAAYHVLRKRFSPR